MGRCDGWEMEGRNGIEVDEHMLGQYCKQVVVRQ